MDSDFLSTFIDRLNQSTVADAAQLIDQLDQRSRDPQLGAAVVNWVSQPQNLSGVHGALTTRFGIPIRAMAIRRIATSRPRRVQMLIQAMRVAIQKAQNT